VLVLESREYHMLKPELVLKFKHLFEKQKREILFARSSIIDPGIILQKDDMLDESDFTSAEMERTMRTRLKNREALFLKKLDEALVRISAGDFGVCSDCGDDIEAKRLEARPTATLCVTCKEAEERHEHSHIDGQRPKSVTARLRLA
jgi:DnaK suppressor protein